MDDAPDQVPPGKKGKTPEEKNSEEAETPAKVQPAEELLNIEIIPGNPNKTTRIGSHLGEEAKKEITLCLQRNADIFAWTPQDLEGIDPQVITHHLNIDPSYKPIKQRKDISGLRRTRLSRQHDGCFTRIPSDHAKPEDRKKQKGRRTCQGLRRDLLSLKEVQVEAQPSQMRFQSTRRSLLGIHGDQRGIKANPLKIKAIIDMKAPTCLNEAQRLTGRIAALSRFISKSAKKACRSSRR
ncbi:UNVERIFIED_CONTAM: hypothetical protein Slati_3453600 [Sesamum latifolium]|uniref:Reverse transcriptase domain-containing protein n=1 Tax=Sesamum latifolium TaxID=2727402 RepID=A0AAW2UGY0_9LAMI